MTMIWINNDKKKYRSMQIKPPNVADDTCLCCVIS